MVLLLTMLQGGGLWVEAGMDVQDADRVVKQVPKLGDVPGRVLQPSMSTTPLVTTCEQGNAERCAHV